MYKGDAFIEKDLWLCPGLLRDQHLDRQIKALLDCGVAERDIVTDKISGTSLEREGYMALRNTMLRDGTP